MSTTINKEYDQVREFLKQNLKDTKWCKHVIPGRYRRYFKNNISTLYELAILPVGYEFSDNVYVEASLHISMSYNFKNSDVSSVEIYVGSVEEALNCAEETIKLWKLVEIDEPE